MICQNCQQRQATTQLTRTVNGQKHSLAVCPICAQELTASGAFDPFGKGDDPFHSFSDYSGPQERVDITELFSERTKEAIQIAAHYALEQKSRNIDTEHLLLGIIKDDEVIEKILKQLDIDRDELISHLEEQSVEGSYDGSTPGLTPRAKKVLELAYQESRELRHNYIGTEHILLALIREGEGLQFV